MRINPVKTIINPVLMRVNPVKTGEKKIKQKKIKQIYIVRRSRTSRMEIKLNSLKKTLKLFTPSTRKSEAGQGLSPATRRG